MSRDRGSVDFLAGFIVGGLVGAAVALIFAPQSGDETRARLRERGIELRDSAEGFSVEAKKRAEGLAGGVQEKSKVALEHQKTRLQEAIEEGKQAASRKKEELLSKLEPAGAQEEVAPEAPAEA